MKHASARWADLHGLAQALAAASLSVDAAEVFLDRQDFIRLRDCLQAAAEALARGGEWINARRAEEASEMPAPRRDSEA
jgi:hypothetical protein